MYTSALVCVLFFLAVGSGNEGHPKNNAAHNLAKGTRKMVLNKPGDIHLYHESIKTDGSLMTSNSQVICYPKKKSKRAKFVITAYTVTDVDNKKGLVYEKEGGGVGKNKVCFHFKGRIGHGYHFDVDIYGIYK